jgi:hypothetical protein
MADLHGLTTADIRKLRDIARKVGGGSGSQRPVMRRRRNPGGSPSGRGGLRTGSGITVDIQLAYVVKQIPARTTGMTYNAEEVTGLVVNPGASVGDDAVLPLVLDDTLKFVNEKWPDDHPTKAGQIMKLRGLNHCWDWPIFGANGKGYPDGTANSQPIWALGFQSEPVEDEPPDFNVIWIDNPVTLIEALTTSAVAGETFDVDTASVLWGLKHKATKFSGVLNPGGWDSDDNARALITRDIETNALVAIDLACPAE